MEPRCTLYALELYFFEGKKYRKDTIYPPLRGNKKLCHNLSKEHIINSKLQYIIP